MDNWLIWLIGVVILVVTGVVAGMMTRTRRRKATRRAAQRRARTAIELAGVSRDACPRELPEAAELLTRAMLLLDDSRGAGAADEAAELAGRADALWQAARG